MEFFLKIFYSTDLTQFDECMMTKPKKQSHWTVYILSSRIALVDEATHGDATCGFGVVFV